eukprot:4496749-Ditylum_brightwellii.AAC.1
MLVASSPEVTLSSLLDTALDPPPSPLSTLVASSPEVALSSTVDAALDPPSQVNLIVHAADSSIHGH